MGVIVLAAIAVMTTTSVIGRSFFDHPILGDFELVQLGSAVVVSGLLPYTQHTRGNIMVDFFTTRASLTAQRRMDRFGVLLYSVVLALITWRVAAGGLSAYASNERSMLMGLPLWIPYALMLPGLALATLVGCDQLVHDKAFAENGVQP